MLQTPFVLFPRVRFGISPGDGIGCGALEVAHGPEAGSVKAVSHARLGVRPKMGGDIGRETGQSHGTESAADGDSEIVWGANQARFGLFSTFAALAAATSNSANGMGT